MKTIALSSDGSGATVIDTESSSRTPGFRLLQEVDHTLVPNDNESALAFCVRKPENAHGFEMWTRHGHRAVSQETFMAQYEPTSSTTSVPDWLENAVRDAWRDPDRDVQATLNRLLENGLDHPGSISSKEVVGA